VLWKEEVRHKVLRAEAGSALELRLDSLGWVGSVERDESRPQCCLAGPCPPLLS